MKTLQVYSNEVTHTPVTSEMIDDAEAYMLWLVKNSDDKQRNFGWARTRRLCLMAFATAYEQYAPGLQAQFLDYHREYKRFPSKIDYKTSFGSFKLATRGIASYKAIGSEITANLSQKMADGGADRFVLAVLGTHYVSFVGWYDRQGLNRCHNREKFVLNELDSKPMSEIWTPN